jgi:hypothetical protein
MSYLILTINKSRIIFCFWDWELVREEVRRETLFGDFDFILLERFTGEENAKIGVSFFITIFMKEKK